MSAVKKQKQQTIDEMLDERDKSYGAFPRHAEFAQRLKEVIRTAPAWHHMTPAMREAAEMIAHKMARVINGDPFYIDSWRDIAGYSTLVVQELELIEQ